MINYIKKTIAFFLQKKIDYLCNRKLSLFLVNVSKRQRNKKLEADYIKTWRKLGKSPSLRFLNIMRSINNIDSPLYVPENIQYGIIEPTLNNKAYELIFNDKNFFEKYLPEYGHLFPKAVLRGMGGVLFNCNYDQLGKKEAKEELFNISNNTELILKPATETGGGENVLLVKKTQGGFAINNKLLLTNDFINYLQVNFHNSFILQKRIIQSAWFSDFNETSVNTIRLYTYRSVQNDEVIPLHAYIRFGGEGSLVDSSSQGGKTIGVQMNGQLNEFALGRFGQKFIKLDFLANKIGGKVPGFDEMINISKNIGAKFYYHRLLGFDFCMDETNKIRLFEINTANIGIINQQMNTGPLYGEYTNEIIQFCVNNRKSIVLDFYV